jgi:hypothetical protein
MWLGRSVWLGGSPACNSQQHLYVVLQDVYTIVSGIPGVHAIRTNYVVLCAVWLCRSEHGAALALPVVLLSLAGLVEDTFGSHFPAWARSSRGVHAMQELAAAPAQMFDPQCCFRTVTVLAGSAAAVVVRQQHDVGPFAAARKRGMHHAVSSAVAAAVGAQPGAIGSRRMLFAASGRGSSPAGMLQGQQQQLGASTAAAAAVHATAAQKLRQSAKRR